jgi:hypothetical protein
MIPRERADYSAIVDRPPLKLPGDARIVFWTIVNFEVWDIGKPMARHVLPAPTGVTPLPDVVHWAFHEYGMRVGCWRFFDLFMKLKIKPTLSANARICEEYPRVAGEARDNGWEFMGHAYEQGPIHKETDQAAMIARTIAVMEKFTGKKSRSAGSALASRKRLKRPTCSPPPASSISATGSMTTSQPPSAPPTARW